MVRFRRLAENDMAQSEAWYEEQEQGLGGEFYRAVSAGVERLRRAPLAPRCFYNDYRKVLLRRFPFALIYKVEGRIIRVYAVFHTAQDPAKWRKRLE